jgi:hypothetical protein
LPPVLIGLGTYGSTLSLPHWYDVTHLDDITHHTPTVIFEPNTTEFAIINLAEDMKAGATLELTIRYTGLFNHGKALGVTMRFQQNLPLERMLLDLTSTGLKASMRVVSSVW